MYFFVRGRIDNDAVGYFYQLTELRLPRLIARQRRRPVNAIYSASISDLQARRKTSLQDQAARCEFCKCHWLPQRMAALNQVRKESGILAPLEGQSDVPSAGIHSARLLQTETPCASNVLRCVCGKRRTPRAHLVAADRRLALTSQRGERCSAKEEASAEPEWRCITSPAPGYRVF